MHVEVFEEPAFPQGKAATSTIKKPLWGKQNKGSVVGADGAYLATGRKSFEKISTRGGVFHAKRARTFH